MELSLPLAETGRAGAGFVAFSAIFLGILFGVFLEQGGMGSARKIAGQFFFRDLSVLKIMFSAIVTTALGLFWFARLGWLDYDLLFIEPTFVWPQAVGGLIFGAGFVIGGLCPGTSCVAISSGRVDGLVLLMGLGLGILGFNELFVHVEDFYRSGASGMGVLPDATGLSHGAILTILVLVALGAFAGAEAIERRSSR